MRNFHGLLILFFTLITTYKANALTELREKKILLEYEALVKKVNYLTPDYQIGPLKVKKYSDHELLWDIGDGKEDYNVIRLYVEKKQTDDFSVSYYLGTHLVKGRQVLRRFLGPHLRPGWRADSIDYQTKRFIGIQGRQEPHLDEADLAMLKNWNIIK